VIENQVLPTTLA